MADVAGVIYSAFGLSFRSNAAIPGLIASAVPASSHDVPIFFDARPPSPPERQSAEELYYTSTEKNEHGEPGFRIWSDPSAGRLRMEYADGIRFWLERRGTAIWCTWPENLTIADAAVYLLGPVLGLLLRLRGVTCLHASAVALADRAVAFAGVEGAGKSTTAGALARRGHAIVSDDIVAVDERGGAFYVLPAHPYLGLWPESVEMLYGPGRTIPQFASIWDKGRLSLTEHQIPFHERALPLGAIFILGDRTDDPAAPYVEDVTARNSLMALVANSYGTNLLGKQMRVREFELLGRLVTRVPTWRLRPSRDRSKLEALCAFIETRCRNLGEA
jgi:hypothetical protein